eukprot:scaffold120780_cov15-Tisochrysis_lutea.AAC.1
MYMQIRHRCSSVKGVVWKLSGMYKLDRPRCRSFKGKCWLPVYRDACLFAQNWPNSLHEERSRACKVEIGHKRATLIHGSTHS